jgi:uncharacterized protein
MSANPIVWWELASHDSEKSVQFFRDVFGWDLQFDEKAGFHKIRHNPPTVSGGGIFTLKRAKLPFLTLYIEVDDIHGMAKKVEEHGGLIVEAPFDIGGGNWICLFNEPSGVTFAMIQEIPASA